MPVYLIFPIFYKVALHIHIIRTELVVRNPTQSVCDSENRFCTFTCFRYVFDCHTSKTGKVFSLPIN